MKTSNPITEEHRTRNNWLKRTAAACAFSGFVAFSPLSENQAYAQEPAQSAPQHTLNCTRPSSVSTGTTAVQGCVINRDPAQSAEITIQGPARVNLRFYPATSADWFSDTTTAHPRTIEYTVGAQGAQAEARTHEGSTGPSQSTSPDIQAPLGVGTPIDFSVSVGPGSQVIRITRPGGILTVVGTEAVAERRVVDPVALPRETPQPRENPQQQPEPRAADPVRRVQGALDGQYMPIRSLGPYSNQGDTYQLRGFWNIPLHPNVALSLGVGTTSHGLSMDSGSGATSASTSLRTYSAEALAGLFFNHERHSFYVLGSAGWRMTQSHITAGAERLDNSDHAFNGYGLVGYEYDRYVRTRFQLGNDPFNPMAGRLYLALPWTWAKTEHVEGLIDLDASLMWLHTMRPRNDGQLGSFALDQDNLLMRFPVRVPIYPIDAIRLVPYAFAAPEYVHSMAGSGSVFNMYLGGALGLDIAPFRMDVYAGSSLQGNPLILLNAGISR
jgi:hypothetical protein